MKLFGRKHEEKPAKQADSLISARGYSVSLVTVISAPDHMIVRCSVRMPFDADENLDVSALNAEGKNVSTKCVFMGRNGVQNSINNQHVFKELVFSVFVPYPEQELIFQVTDETNKQPIHEQLFSTRHIADLRAQQDNILYKNASNDPYYTTWFNSNQRLGEYELQEQRVAKFDVELKLSIVVSLCNSPIESFQKLADSIEKQTYANWELILVNAGQKDAEINKAVSEVCKSDARIKSVELQKDEGITLNTAAGIDAAEGDFICFVHSNSALEPHCLFEYVQRINEKPETDLLYCDEDQLFQDGHLGNVFFKPEFSLHLLRSFNYIGNMLCIRRSFLQKLNYKQSEFDGAQSHHLALHAVEKTGNICHIPKVLYHASADEEIAANDATAQQNATNETVKAVSAHLKRLNIDAAVTQSNKCPLCAKVEYALPENKPLVSIVIPTHDSVNILKTCVNSILNKTTYDNYEIILVENNSKEPETFEYYKSLENNPKIRITVCNMPPNVAKFNNHGCAEANGEYYVLMNNDTEVITHNWLETMLGLCSQPEIGIVACKLLFPDNTIQDAGVVVGNEPKSLFVNLPNGEAGYFNFPNIQREVGAATSACIMTKASVYDQVKGFDEKLPFDYNDVDYSFKVRKAGKQVVYAPFAEIYHYESASRGTDVNVNALSNHIFARGHMMAKWPELYATPDAYATPNVRQDVGFSYYNF